MYLEATKGEQMAQNLNQVNQGTFTGIYSNETGFNPPLTLVENLKTPLITDNAHYESSPVPPDHMPYLKANQISAVIAEHDKQKDKAKKEIANYLWNYDKNKEKFKALKSELKEKQNKLSIVNDRTQQVYDLLGARVRNFSKFKYATIITFIMFGEIFLNTQAAVFGGGDLVGSLVAFSGVGGAILGISLLGAELRGIFNKITASEVTDETKKLGIDQFFRDPNQNLIPHYILGGIIVLSILLMSISIGLIRSAVGSSSVYGIFTGITVLGATVANFMMYDPIGFYLNKLGKRIQDLRSELAKLEDQLNQNHVSKKAKKEFIKSEKASVSAATAAAISVTTTALLNQSGILGNGDSKSKIITCYEDVKSLTKNRKEFPNKNQGGVAIKGGKAKNKSQRFKIAK